MKTQAYEEWITSFTKDAENVWLNERPELKRAAMILTVLKTEFKRIENDITNELTFYRQQLECNDFYKKESHCNVKPSKQNKFLQDEKENTSPCSKSIKGITPLQISTLQNKNESVVSPEIFLCQESADVSMLSSLNQQISQVDLSCSSDEAVNIQHVDTSPRINKRRIFNRNRKAKNITCSYSVLNIAKEMPKTPKIVIDNSYNTPEGYNKQNVDLIESTIIENTPEQPVAMKKLKFSKIEDTSKKKKKHRIPKFNKAVNNSTLTQMFTNISTSTKNGESVRQELSYDLDPTQCNVEPASTTNRLDTIMGNLTDYDETKIDDTMVQEVTKEPDKSSVNKFIKPNIVYKTKPVRGKERMKLEGWDCEECKKFYEGLDMDPVNAKYLLNKCSKHRSKFAPEKHETPAGFWNLTFSPTQTERDNTEVNSLVFKF